MGEIDGPARDLANAQYISHEATRDAYSLRTDLESARAEIVRLHQCADIRDAMIGHIASERDDALNKLADKHMEVANIFDGRALAEKKLAECQAERDTTAADKERMRATLLRIYRNDYHDLRHIVTTALGVSAAELEGMQ